MARRNYFELLGLDFDPPEGNKRRIEKAIETWEITLSSQLGSETDSVRRGKLKEELDLKGDMSAVMGDPKRRKMEADELKTLRMRQLEKLIDVMRFEQMGTPVVSFGMIRNVQQKLKLAQKNCRGYLYQEGLRRTETSCFKCSEGCVSAQNRCRNAPHEARTASHDDNPRIPLDAKRE